MVVLDTATLLYWTLDPNQLSRTARDLIEKSERVIVSSISVWEIALKVKLRKLEIPLSIKEFAERLQRIEKLETLPVDVQTWLDNLDLDWDHRDPANRTIVAIAARLACPLITSDKIIAEFYPQSIW